MPSWFNPGFVILVGAIIVALGGYWQFRRQTSSSERLVAKSEEIADLNRQLAGKSEEIARLSLDTLAAITGGDSFCYLTLTERESPAGPLVLVVSQGKFPLYDVSARLVDVNRLSALRPEEFTLERLSALDTNLNVGNLAPDSGKILVRLPPFGGVSRRRFTVVFYGRNGFWNQRIQLQVVNGQWKQATSVARNVGPILFEKIDEGFPLNNAGQVDW